MTVRYPNDEKMLAGLSAEKRSAFIKYMGDLDAENVRRGQPYGEGSLWKTTGAECWLSFFDDDYTPSGAIDDDLSNA